jgi:hypothetical protein
MTVLDLLDRIAAYGSITLGPGPEPKILVSLDTPFRLKRQLAENFLGSQGHHCRMGLSDLRHSR